MKTIELTPKMRRQRKFLLVAPLLVLPFLTLFFWTLGGGKVSAADTKDTGKKGFNMDLPGAKLKDSKGADKMSYYSRAAADSAKMKQAEQTDPYAKKHADTIGHSLLTGSAYSSKQASVFQPVNGRTGNNPSASEAQVYQKLAALQEAINKPVPPNPQYAVQQPAANAKSPVQSASNAKPQEDPEMKQMNGLLEKILDIQHPDRVKENAKGKDSINNSRRFSAIPAVIEGNQKVTEGTVVRLKLLDTVTINGQLFPKGQLVFAAGSLYNQRMVMTIKNIHIGYEIIPVDLTVFDMNDGLEGISVPEAITADAAKNGAADGVSGMQFMSMDETMGAQAAAAGINAAKGLFSKKVKRVKGKLKGGHPLLLRDNQKVKNSH